MTKRINQAPHCATCDGPCEYAEHLPAAQPTPSATTERRYEMLPRDFAVEARDWLRRHVSNDDNVIDDLIVKLASLMSDVANRHQRMGQASLSPEHFTAIDRLGKAEDDGYREGWNDALDEAAKLCEAEGRARIGAMDLVANVMAERAKRIRYEKLPTEKPNT